LDARREGNQCSYKKEARRWSGIAFHLVIEGDDQLKGGLTGWEKKEKKKGKPT